MNTTINLSLDTGLVASAAERWRMGSLLLKLSKLCCLIFFALPVWAQQDATADWAGAVRQWLDQPLHAQTTSDQSLRLEVTLGSLDPRLRLAPCSRVEPYLPANTRLWGKTRIGVRCVEGITHWNVFLPVTVKAWGQAWVLKSNVLPGTVLRPEDALQAEVDWAADAAPVLAKSDQWVGQVAAYPLLAGQTIRQAMLHPAQVFAAGSNVRIVANGTGFQISSEGQALGAGVVGQLVRVKTENGSVLTGSVLDAHTVVVNF